MAITQLKIDWGETDPGDDPEDRDVSIELEVFKSILKHQNRAALCINAKNNQEEYKHSAAEYYYVLDGEW